MIASVNRQRAEEMLAQASRAQTDDLRALYLDLAEEWRRMADEAEAPAMSSESSQGHSAGA